MPQSVGQTADTLIWRSRGACKDLDLTVFFPPRGGSVDPQAVRACENCPVRAECFDHALRHEMFGYWAGTSERKRRILRKKAGIRYESPSAFFDHPYNCTFWRVA